MKGVSNGVIISERGERAIFSEFESYLVPHISGLVLS